MLPTRNSADHQKRVGIWLRVSTEDQARGESPEHHEQRARYYAEAKSWEVVEVYHLEGVSGKSVWNHPECQRMLADIRSGHITGLIFSKLARLARSTRELLDFADSFKSHGADLVSLQESIDTSTPAGRLFYTMIAAMAQWEREEIADRVAASVPVRAKLGKPLSGAAPFGYRWVDKRLVPDPSEVPIRRLIYELFLQHRRKLTVARRLNEAGHRTRKGALWTGITIERLITDPTAKGQHRANYTKSQGRGRSWVSKPESEWVYQPVEPIVSEELWEACNEIIRGRKAAGRPATKRTVHLFSGFAFCACGTKMYVPSNSPKYTCQSCRNKIPIETLETVFIEQLRGFFFSPVDVEEYLRSADQTIHERAELLENLERERRGVAREMEKVYRLYMEDGVNPEGFKALYQPLQDRAAQLDDEIPRLAGELDFLKLSFLSSEEVVSEGQHLYTRWPDLTPEEKRSVIETITERIVIDRNEVTLSLSYVPSSTSSKELVNSAHSPSAAAVSGRWRPGTT